MNILIAHNSYSHASGEEQAIERLATILQSRGHQVQWFRRTSTGLEESQAAKFRAFFSGIHNPFTSREIARILEAGKFDLVQVQNLYPLLSPSILRACKSAALPVVLRCPNYRLTCPTGLHYVDGQICERCLGPGKEWNCLVRNCAQTIARSSGYAARNAFARTTRSITNTVDCFLVFSEFQKRRFMNFGIAERKIAVLHNVAPSIEKSAESDVGDFVAFVGRISPEKGVTEFLEAARRLPRIPFVIAGHAHAFPGIHQLATPNVEFKGFLDEPNLDRLYRKCRIVVIPSRWFEGFPNVATSAMVHRKPVVASNIGALGEIIDDASTGLLFRPGDSSDLATKIGYLWDRPTLCKEYGERGYQKALLEYSEDSFYSKLMTAYYQASGDRRWLSMTTLAG